MAAVCARMRVLAPLGWTSCCASGHEVSTVLTARSRCIYTSAVVSTCMPSQTLICRDPPTRTCWFYIYLSRHEHACVRAGIKNDTSHACIHAYEAPSVRVRVPGHGRDTRAHGSMYVHTDASVTALRLAVSQMTRQEPPCPSCLHRCAHQSAHAVSPDTHTSHKHMLT